MAKYASMVEETTETTGTSDLVLTGATTGHRALSAAFAADDYVNYLIRDANGTAWERGYGKFNGTTGLTRQYVKESSNSDNKITLTAGEHTVTIAAHPGMAQFQGFYIYTTADQSLSANTETDITFQAKGSAAEDDTENTITVPVTDIIVPDWVELVRVRGYFKFSSATNNKYIRTCSHQGVILGPDGNRREKLNGHQRIQFVSNVFRPYQHTSGQSLDYGFTMRALAVTAMDLLSGAWIQCEFVQ